MSNNVDEMTIVTIIASAGEAISLMYAAYDEVVNKNYDAAKKYYEQSEESLLKAHHEQTRLIQEEINGDGQEITLLMVHAQDHLMNAVLTKQLIVKMMQMQKEINDMKGEEK